MVNSPGKTHIEPSKSFGPEQTSPKVRFFKSLPRSHLNASIQLDVLMKKKKEKVSCS